MKLDQLFPLIVPSEYYSLPNTWDLPHYSFPNQNFGLTWVFFEAEGAMTYLTRSEYEELERSQSNWQQQAFENLRNSIDEQEGFHTHYKMSDDGQRLIFIAFMNSDGIGSSRTLLSVELAAAFPQGYAIAFPDRSCGLIIANNITDDELIETLQLIETMYDGATTAMAQQLLAPAEVAGPSQWVWPIDLPLSQSLIAEILKLNGNLD
jgi:hypothetical protein